VRSNVDRSAKQPPLSRQEMVNQSKKRCLGSTEKAGEGRGEPGKGKMWQHGHNEKFTSAPVPFLRTGLDKSEDQKPMGVIARSAPEALRQPAEKTPCLGSDVASELKRGEQGSEGRRHRDWRAVLEKKFKTSPLLQNTIYLGNVRDPFERNCLSGKGRRRNGKKESKTRSSNSAAIRKARCWKKVRTGRPIASLTSA